MGIAWAILLYNVSARQFRDRHILNLLDNSLEKHDLTRDAIQLEVTEKLIMQDVELARSILSEVTFPGDVSAPVIGKRQASTDVTVQDKHTLVIGGLMESRDRIERNIAGSSCDCHS